MKSFAMVLAVWVVLGLVQLVKAEQPSGCVKTAKTCNCYTAQGKRVELEPHMCLVVMAPAPVVLAGGDMSALVTKPKTPEPERTPFVKAPITWLIER